MSKYKVTIGEKLNLTTRGEKESRFTLTKISKWSGRSVEKLNSSHETNTTSYKARFVDEPSRIQRLRFRLFGDKEWVKTDSSIEGRGTLYLKGAVCLFEEPLQLKSLIITKLSAERLQAPLSSMLLSSEKTTTYSQTLLTELDKKLGTDERPEIQKSNDLPVRGWHTKNGIFLKGDVLLGEGTYKQVFKGLWVSKKLDMSRDVAISMIKLEDSDDTTEKNLLEEDRVAREIDSPYVVSRAYDIFKSEDKRYIFIASRKYASTAKPSDLTKALGRDPTTHEKLTIARDVALGIQAMHKKGYIHRDIKAENVFVKIDPTTKKVTGAVIGDLGFAGKVNKFPKNRIPGTQFFTPSSTISRGRWTKRDELYSFGMFLIQLYKPNKLYTAEKRKHMGSVNMPNLTWGITKDSKATKARELVYRLTWKSRSDNLTFKKVILELDAILTQK